ncbi:MAG TPA: IS110 family transposase [Burkholderiales bacterium]|nr:IS110 family transposase [Burkholderiales bacterium]
MMEEAVAVRKRELAVMFPNAAGIDIGSAKHYVAVPPERCERSVREFESFTEDLLALAQWLASCGVDTVVMESTGVYWIPLYELLEARGFTVYLVNARHIKNVSGKKSDVLDCQWLQQLMSFGLLAGAFRPDGEVCALRAVVRQRDTLIEGQAQQIQRMQKALTQMNVQLANVISDIAGKTGQDIVRAIVAGERDAHKLAQLRNYRVHASEAQIAKSLLGNWREEHLFCLAQTLKLFDTHQALIDEADAKLEVMLAQMQRSAAGALKPNKNKGRAKHAPRFDVRSALVRWAGVDLTRIGGIDVSTALKVLAEIGADLSKFKSAKHFASWLGLCPGTRITGGKRISGVTKRIPNRVAQALKLAAHGLHRSQCALGAYYRRMAARLGAGKAITATAHKLARLVYAILTKGEEFIQRSQDHYEDQVRTRTIRYLQKKAASLGFNLQPNTAVCA